MVETANINSDTELGLDDLREICDASFDEANLREVAISVTQIIRGNDSEIRKGISLGESTSVTNKHGGISFDSVSGTTSRSLTFHSHPPVLPNSPLALQEDVDFTKYAANGSAIELLPSHSSRFLQSETFAGTVDLSLTYPTFKFEERLLPFDRGTNNISGGALNILGRSGLTMFVGSEAMDSSEFTSIRVQKRAGKDLDDYSPTWKIIYGSNVDQIDPSMRAFTDRMEAAKAGVDLLADHGVGVTRLDYYGAQRSMYFVSLSWERIEELAPLVGGMHEICFGNGIDDLMEILSEKYEVPDIPHSTNLSEALIQPVFPRRRGHEVQLAQQRIYDLLHVDVWDEDAWQNCADLMENFDNLDEMEDGVEFRALAARMLKEKKWPDEVMSKALDELLVHENRTQELVNEIHERARLEKVFDKDANYYDRLPQEIFEKIKVILTEKYHPGLNNIFSERAPGDIEIEDNHFYTLLHLLKRRPDSIKAYVSDLTKSAEKTDRDLADWLRKIKYLL